MQTKTLETPPQSAAVPAETEVMAIDALCASLRECSSDRMAWKQAADWLGRSFEAEYVLIEFDGRSGSSSVTPASAADESWQPLCDALILKARQGNEVVTRASGEGLYAVAVPMSEGGAATAVGAVAMAFHALGDAEAESRSRELLAYLRICESAVQRRQPKGQTQQTAAGSIQQGVSQAGTYASLHQYAFAITNGLKAKFGCDEVAISILRGDKARILSISGMDSLHPRSPGSKAMQHAMEEAADAEACVVAPNNYDENSLVDLPLHQQWLKDSKSIAVASIPLRHADEIVGVVGMRRTDGTNFSEAELTEAKTLVAPLASGLVLLDQANRSLAAHARASLAGVSGKWATLATKTRAAIVCGTVLLLGWVLLGSTTYTLQVPCEVVALEPLEISVPFESRIIKAHVRPGDYITAGQPLLEFDTGALMAERERLAADLQIAEIATVEALTLNDIAGAGRARNQADAARAGLRTVNEQIGQAIVVAPFDGYVIEGDVLRRLGETLTVGTEIMQLAAADRLAVDLRVSEGGATYVDRGMPGQFNTTARPGEVWDCEICQVDASASVVEGENIFKAQAEPRGDTADWLRPGMQGIARIDAGSHPVWWVYLHGMTDWVRMQAWKL